MDAIKIPVLLIDDDVIIAQMLGDYVDRFGFKLEACQEPNQGIELLRGGKYQVLLLDIMMPSVSGFDVCKMVRKYSEIPIIMLSAKGEVTDKVKAFEYGADDYLAKPFEVRELVARMQRLVKRQGSGENAAQEAIEVRDAFKIDADKRQVVINNNAIDLTNIEFDILTLLSKEPGVVFDRNRILQHVKGLNEDVTLQTRAIDNSISRLRRKLHERGNAPQLIRTVWGQGYSFSK